MLAKLASCRHYLAMTAEIWEVPDENENRTVPMALAGRETSYLDSSKLYLNDIGRVALLTAEQEVDLAKTIESGLFAERVLEVRQAADEDKERLLDGLGRSIYEATIVRLQNRTKLQSNGADDSTSLEKSSVKKQLSPELDKQAKRESDEGVAIIQQYAFNKKIASEDLATIADMGRAAKSQMIEANLRWVVKIANRYSEPGLETRDHVQDGNDGLIRAVEKFDFTRGYKFSTYSEAWIRQTISRGIADRARAIRLPIYLTDVIHKMKSTAYKMEQTDGIAPSPEDLAKALKMPVKTVVHLQEVSRNVVSLNISINEDGDTELGDLLVASGRDGNEVEETVLSKDMQTAVRGLLKNLSEVQAQILSMRYGLDGEAPKSMQLIANTLGLTRERVVTIERNALKRLRGGKDGRACREFLRDY